MAASFTPLTPTATPPRAIDAVATTTLTYDDEDRLIGVSAPGHRLYQYDAP
ncbi:MAG: hypothetical protein U0736_10300 [Gemmataceae bacterium]